MNYFREFDYQRYKWLHQRFIKSSSKASNARRFPIKLQPRVTAELDRLQKKGLIESLTSCSDENFISPIVNRVKKV